MDHIGVGESCSKVQRGAPFANVATLCRPPGSCVALDVIMSLLILSIGNVQCIMDLLTDVLNVLNEAISLVNFGLDMSQIFMSSCKWYGHINGT